MKHDPEPRRLLEDILEEIAPADFRADLLERTLQQARRRRRRRRWNQALLTAALLMAGGWSAWRWSLPKRGADAPPPSLTRIVTSRPLDPSLIVESKPGSIEVVTSRTSSVDLVETRSSPGMLRRLNDEELLALFNGKPVVLVRQGPQQAELLIVDSKARIARPVEEWDASKMTEQ